MNKRCFFGASLAMALLAEVAGVSAGAVEKVSPPIPGGIVAIWLQSPSFDSENILKQTFVKGGQVVVQWEQLEPEKGKYDFSALDSQLAIYAKRGLPVTVQINGNRKPHYLFDEVPYAKDTSKSVAGFRQVDNREGVLMYWHPAHKRAYVNCLAAFRDYLQKTPYKSSILGLRMNFNPFGTEIVTLVPPPKAVEYASKELWQEPAGLDKSIPYNGYNKADTLDYVRHIIRKHIELFAGVAPMFIRCTVDEDVLKEFAPYFENGTFGLMETVSCYAPFAAKTEADEEWLCKYCKTGKTFAYAESFSDAWGIHTFRDEYTVSPPQAFYWRMLGDLHKGVSYIAVYGRDLNVALTGELRTNSRGANGKNAQVRYSDAESGFNYQREFHEAILFADKYAGHHEGPEKSPGAWAAFRDNDAVSNARSTGQKLKLPDFTGDYTFLMERLPDKSTGLSKVGPNEIRFGAFARRLPPHESIRLKVDGRFLHSLANGACEVRLTYFDDNAGGAILVSAGGKDWTAATKGTKKWETASFRLMGGTFQPDADGAQVTIRSGDAAVTLHLLEFLR